MSPMYLLLIGLFLFCGFSDGENETGSETQVDLIREKRSDKSRQPDRKDQNGQDSTMNSSQDSDSLYQIGHDVGVLSETQKSIVTRLEKTIKRQDANMKRMEETIKKQDANMKRMEETIRRLEASEAQLAAINNTLSTVLNKEKIHVAFTVSRPVDGSLTAGSDAHVPLVYKHVETNLGNAYSPLTGFFTASVKGVYSFSFTSMYLGTGSSGGSLHHNGKRVVSWHRNEVNHRTSGSNSAVLILNAGDKVNVYLWGGTTIFGHVYNYSTFSGFLLYAL